jgi:tRNA U34 5-methylaminomethyl-2-thiouridine-forming methyltransferase MnmC
MLDGLLERGLWQGGSSRAALLWGDARQRVGELLEARQLERGCDLVLLDAFSPQRCPELWSLEFLSLLARLLKPDGRLLTYCCAAAVRRSLQLAGLQLASIAGPPPAWSYGTAASPGPLAPPGAHGPLRPLTPMEQEHLATRAAVPYRDLSGRGGSAVILAERQQAQASSQAGSTSAWRRRWGLANGAAVRSGRPT